MTVEKVLWKKAGKGIVTQGRIPTEAEYFKDHFPGFPVLPGVLALEMLKKTAELYLKQDELVEKETRYYLKTIRSVKFSNYLKPGDEWESHLELLANEEDQTRWNAKLMHQGKIAVSARLTLSKVAVANKLAEPSESF